MHILSVYVNGGIPLVPAVSVHNISKRYHTVDGEVPALDNISFEVSEGEFIGIVGPSGCGKSTLLSIISGLIKPSSGQVSIFGEKLTGVNPKIGYMLQRDSLFEWRTIYKNVILGLEIQNQVTPDRLKHVEYLLEKYGLINFRNHYPSQLSGGMRQRAALIRTLAVNPDILLLDEAFSALDYQTRLAVNDDIYKIIKKEGKTAIMVTHDISEAISMSERLYVLTKRPGRIKLAVDIKFGIENRTPLSSREAPEFRQYFNKVWKELDVHV
jgi:NitT/TauT family transport system ATP-binding protein